ncbi:hypothetical protein D3C87_2102110 [compost metagenome]
MDSTDRTGQLNGGRMREGPQAVSTAWGPPYLFFFLKLLVACIYENNVHKVAGK